MDGCHSAVCLVKMFLYMSHMMRQIDKCERLPSLYEQVYLSSHWHCKIRMSIKSMKQ